jgi:hypothetical protein
VPVVEPGVVVVMGGGEAEMTFDMTGVNLFRGAVESTLCERGGGGGAVCLST